MTRSRGRGDSKTLPRDETHPPSRPQTSWERRRGKEAGEAAPTELPGVAPPTTQGMALPTTQGISPLPSSLGAPHLLHTDYYRCSLWIGETQEQREVRRLEEQDVWSQKTCHLLAVFFSKPSAGPSSASLSAPVKWDQPSSRKQVPLTHAERTS